LATLAISIPQATIEQNSLREEAEKKMNEFKKNSDYEICFAVYGNTQVPELPQMMEYFSMLGFKITDIADPDLDSEKSTEIHKVNPNYTKKGQEKLDYVVNKMQNFSGIQIMPEKIPSSDTLPGNSIPHDTTYPHILPCIPLQYRLFSAHMTT